MRILPLLAAGLLLSAPIVGARAAIITNEDVHLQYDYSEFYAVAGGKEFEVVVRGNPTSVPQPQFEARLMQLLTQSMRSSDTHPTTSPAVRTRSPNYRLVLVFNLDSGELGTTLCGDLSRIVPPATVRPGRLTVAAAYCRNADPMTEAFARTTAASLDDPAAQALFDELTSVLFPSRPGLLPNRNMFNGIFR